MTPDPDTPAGTSDRPAPSDLAPRVVRPRAGLADIVHELGRDAQQPWPRPTVLDLALVVLLSVFSVGGLYFRELGMRDVRDPDVWGVLLALLTAVPLLWRGAHSLRVLVAVSAAGLLLAGAHYESAGAGIGQIVALYAVAVGRSRVPAALALAFTESATVVWLALRDSDIVFLDVVANLAAIFAVWAFARSVGFRRAYTAELEARAERLERTREADTRAAIAEERGRIARELHDVVAHHVSVMTVQASAAQRMVARNPDRAKEAMAAVEQTGRGALVEMRRLVGILRDTTDAVGGPNEGHNAPQPGLDQLDTLVTQVREAGLPVELSLEGAPCALPPGIDLAAYRIVQEALTNTLKHAGPAEARVLLRYSRTELLVRVADDGRGGSTAPTGERTGHGLLGMRERVSLYGGRLYAGPRAQDGFEVLARIPLSATNPNDTAAPPDGVAPDRLEQTRP
ncbi:two-component sensor histidine kinase [Embleya hyalina]|uniref:histidine kinase n=1 Tax=Embleya hyalina TaxID=516124 RepID=A0A401YGR2_9ACTN|nr:two-component sensor histidine kinase [Embleya hyalina]